MDSGCILSDGIGEGQTEDRVTRSRQETFMLSENTLVIVRATVPFLQARGEELTRHFYADLFRENPDLWNIFNPANQHNGSQARSLAAAILGYAANIDHPERLTAMIDRISNKHVSLQVKPEHYPIVGHYLLKAIRTILGDAADDAVIDAWAAAYGQLADIMIAAEGQIEQSAAAGHGWEGYRPLTVLKKVWESELVTSLHLGTPDGSPLPRFRAGQYLGVKLVPEVGGYSHIRQYSLSNSPQDSHYRISVRREPGDLSKATPEGVVSSYIHEAIQVGHPLLAHPPVGDFLVDSEAHRPIVLLSAGSGITPTLSMLHELTNGRETQRRISFIHATHGGSHHAFGEEVRAVAARHPALSLATFYEKPETADEPGRDFHEAAASRQKRWRGTFRRGSRTSTSVVPLPSWPR
jgi:nitric oxide dioxygenase